MYMHALVISIVLQEKSRFQAFGVVRCGGGRDSQEKKPRVRKTKEERREMVESFINMYRSSNNGKFPSVNLTHKEVGGSYYIVREIVRDVIQENRVLGPGGLNSKSLSFDDCPDSSELSIAHEIDEENVGILDMHDENQDDKNSELEMSNSEEVFSSQKNVISTQQLLGSSNLLDVGFLNGVVQNGSIAGATSMETNLGEQDDANSSEKQVPLLAHVSNLDKEIEPDGLQDAHEEITNSISNGIMLSLELNDNFQANGELPLQEHEMLPNDDHDDTANSVADEANISPETSDVLQTNGALSLQEHDVPPESIATSDVPIVDGEVGSTIPTGQMNTFTSSTSYRGTENPPKSNEMSKVQRDEFEQSLLDDSPDEQESSKDLVSHPMMETKELVQMKDKYNAVEEDEIEFKDSISAIIKDEHEASDAKHGHGISATTAISRITAVKAQRKKQTNAFWLTIRAIINTVIKFWTE